MKYINVSSIQQYTIDTIRISFNYSNSVELYRRVRYEIFDSENNDVSNLFKTITESNDWRYITETPTCDITLKENTNLSEGNYTIIIYNSDKEIYRTKLNLHYMEDIRVDIDKVIMKSLNTLFITFKPKNESFPIYQSKEMMGLMKFSIIDESGTFFSDNFLPITDEINKLEDGSEVKSLQITLKDGYTLPDGFYDLRFTNIYKSRTFPIIESFDNHIGFMTTTPPSIGEAYISKNSKGEFILTVLFNSYLERGLLNSATRKFVRLKDNKDVTSYFNADRISTTSYSLAGINYITKLDIPFVSRSYSLEKGEYKLIWAWNNDILNDVEYTLNVKWVVKSFENISLWNAKGVNIDLPKSFDINSFLESESYTVELNGSEINTDFTFGEIIRFENGVNDDPTVVEDRSDRFTIPITNFDNIVEGTYTFVLWSVAKDGTLEYDYMGSINIISELSPSIKEIYQSNMDTITVVLEKPQPIEAIKKYIPKLLDQYGSIDLSNKLTSIENSNIWEPGQTMSDRFDIVISDTTTVPTGEYLLKLNFYNNDSEPHKVSLQYMETRKGIIEKIEQTSISTIKIIFSKPQSRQFLLSTTFDVERKLDGANFTDRFEYLENVLKADQSIFTEIEIPIDHEDSLPAARYRISFLFIKEDKEINTVVYSYDVELGYMTSCVPTIKSISVDKSVSGLDLIISFGNPLEFELLNSSIFKVVRLSDNTNIANNFADKESWKKTTTSRRNIKLIKSLNIPLRNEDEVVIERGKYNIGFSWDGIIQYLEDVLKESFFEYYLPLVKRTEIVSFNMTNRTGRIYFELDEEKQYSYFENLKVEVLDPMGHDACEYFDTIQNSNNINSSRPESEKIATNSFNLNILDTEEVHIGKYQFIFYHNLDGIRRSRYISYLDITTVLSPRIASAEQKAINKILITLREPIPRRLLEEFDFRFVCFDNRDYTDYFLSIDQANDWAEDLREVSSFYIEIASGYALEKDAYLFTMYNGNLECDSHIFRIDQLEGASGEILETKPLNLSTLEIVFREEESLALFRSLSLNITNQFGVDYTNKFEDLYSALAEINTDYFDTLQLKVLGPIPEGIYNFTFEKYYTGTLDIVCENEVSLHYMNNEYPLLYEVSATKIGDIMDGDDGLVMWFSPPLEKSLFDNAKFGIVKVSNNDVDFAKKFKDISEAILDTHVVDGITYIDYATLEFGNKETLNRDDYLVKFEWCDEYDYMKNLEREIRLNYILFPLKNVEQISTDTIKLSFKTPVLGSKMNHSELFVTTIYSTENDDGAVITEVDFSDQFRSLKDTNSIEDNEKVSSLITKMGTRNPDKPAEPILPENTYRFIIAEEIVVEDGNVLQYAYAGTCKIDMMVNADLLEADCNVVQTSYDTLKFTFEKAQLTSMLNKFSVFIRREDPNTGDIKDYSNMFKDTLQANYYERLGNNGEIERGYYYDANETDIVINEIHYLLNESETALAKLNTGNAIPAHTYKIGFIYRNNEYFHNEISVPFMTADPPKISSITIEEMYLKVRFSPAAEFNSLMESSFTIMTNRGYYTDGTIKGDDVTHNFNKILDGIIEKRESYEIFYVDQISIPIKENAFLASGRYTIRWIWPKKSFLPVSEYTGGLIVMGIGVKSVRTFTKDTIEIILSDKYLAKDVKKLSLAVMDSNGIDRSEAFVSLEESNSNITDETQTDTFYIKLDDGEFLTSNLYHFTLSPKYDDIDEDENIHSNSEMIAWGMNLIYLASDFPSIERVDNLSIEKYDIVLLENYNISSYMGKQVQLATSQNTDEIEILSDDNLSLFKGQHVRVYGDPDITKLSIVFDEEIDIGLIKALNVSIQDSDGNDVSDYFLDPISSNNTVSRKVLHSISITFTYYSKGNKLNQYDFTIETSDGKDITEKFIDINKSNIYDDDTNYKEMVLMVDDGSIVEEYDSKNIRVKIENEGGKIITNFKTRLNFKTISSISTMTLELAPEKTIIPDVYSLIMSYSNEPDIPNSVTIYPFSYSGRFPFLSNNLGNIKEMIFVDMENIDISFTIDLPVSIFRICEFGLYNEDGDEVDVVFEDLNTSNNFDDYLMISELNNPGMIRLKISEESSIEAGNYTIKFWIDLATNDDIVEIEDENEEIDINRNIGKYVLWEKTDLFPSMMRDQSNSITSVDIISIDTLRLNLKKPIKASLIKSFNVDAFSTDNDRIYSDKFLPTNESNFFGIYYMPTGQRFILYSDNGESWNRFNTGMDCGINKVFYHNASGCYIALCNNGNIIKFNEFSSNQHTGSISVDIVDYGNKVGKSLNDYVLLENTIIVVGNDGVILKGEITNNGEIRLNNVNEKKNITKNTLTSITQIPDSSTLVICGYRGTVIRSTDNGSTWSVIPTGFKNNFSEVYFHSDTLNVYEDENEPENDDNEIIPPKVIESIKKSSLFIIGTNGLILYTENLDSGFTKLETGTSKSILGITSHESKLVAVGDSGLIIFIDSSEDGFIPILIENPDISFALSTISYCDNRFIAGGVNGKWISSVAGRKWTIHNTNYSSAIKSIGYTPSQYDNDMGDYLYIKLKPGAELGAVNFYKGYDEPTLASSFCSSWDTEDKKNSHVYDIYTRFEFKDSRPTPFKWYQFRKIIETSGEESDGDEPIIESIDYQWVECTELDKPHSGNFHFRLKLGDEDSEDYLYSTEEPIDVPYLTSSPGQIEKVELLSPDIENGPEFIYPFIKVNFNRGNENALHYANYQFIGPDNNDFTNNFQSLRLGTINYSGGLDMNSVIIYGTPNTISTPSGLYSLKWNWMALAPDVSIIIPEIKVKSMKELMTSSISKENFNKISFNLNKAITKDYLSSFNASGKESVIVNIRKVPKSEKEIEDYNYYSYFNSIEKSTDFSQPEYYGSETVSKFDIKTLDGIVMDAGEYIIKLDNNIDSLKLEKDDDENMWISTHKISLMSEIRDQLPTISNVSLENYFSVPKSPIEGAISNSFSGEGSPTDNEEMAKITLNWLKNYDELLRHIGDTYLDQSNSDRYYFINDKKNSSNPFHWQKRYTKPYLTVSFEVLPVYDTFITGYQNFSLYDNKGDYTSLFSKDINYWDFELNTLNKVKQISKIHIPLDDLANFPGSQNATFELRFSSFCIYSNLIKNEIKLPQALHDYGDIISISCFNPDRPNAPADSGYNRSDAGLVVKFEKFQLKEFIRGLSLEIVKNDKNEPIDVTNSFKGIIESNSDLFEDSAIDRIDNFYLLLQEGKVLDHGNYIIRLSGLKPSSDLYGDSDGDGEMDEINFSFKFKSPWLSKKIPTKFKASIIKDSGGPKLQLKFDEFPPPASSLMEKFGGLGGNASILVVDHIPNPSFSIFDKYIELDPEETHGVTKKYRDVSGVFRSLTAESVKFYYDENYNPESIEKYIDHIDIPMKNSRCLKEGTYDVYLNYPSSSKLNTIPNVYDSGYIQFTLSNPILSKIGEIKSITTKGKKLIIKFQKNADIATDHTLRLSAIGRILGVTTWSGLMKKMNLKITKGGKEFQSSLDKSKGSVSNLTYTTEIKKNKKIKPGKYKFEFKFNGATIMKGKTVDFAGLIFNAVGDAANDPIAWIINETNPDGKELCRVYKSYEKALKRIKRLRNLNRIAKYQHKLCKMCRKIKLLSTKKIKGCINSYDFPYQYKKGTSKFFKRVMKKWYRYRTTASSEKWKVEMTLGPGKYLNEKGEIENLDPNTSWLYKCSTTPFNGFEFEEQVNGNGAEKEISYGCANYVKSENPWKWDIDIATVKKGEFPSSDKTKIYFATITWKGTTFARGFKSTKKGKKSSKYKEYMKTLKKKVKKREDAIGKCNKCRKRVVAERNGKPITWNAALFPIRVITLDRMKNVPGLLNVSQKEGGFKGKKKGLGCKSPSFKWTKTTVKKKQYTKLKCMNCKEPDPSLKTGGFQGIYHK